MTVFEIKRIYCFVASGPGKLTVTDQKPCNDGKVKDELQRVVHNNTYQPSFST